MSNPLPPNFKLVLTFLLPLAAQAQTNCDLAGRPFTLPHLEAAIATGQLSLLILAPAAQSPTGTDTDRDDGSLPFRIAASLRAQRPSLAIDLGTIDNTGLTLAEALPILADRLSQRPAALVIWQVGTAEIARAIPAASLGTSLADAVRLISANNADLLLIDPDPDPALDSQPNFQSIEATLSQAASHPGVALYQQRSRPAACVSHGIAHLITHS